MLLFFPGPFVTTRDLTRSIKSSTDRPKAIQLAEVFEQLEADSLGTRRARSNTKVFFKVLPCSVTSLSLLKPTELTAKNTLKNFKFSVTRTTSPNLIEMHSLACDPRKSNWKKCITLHLMSHVM